MNRKMDETGIAELIVSALPGGIARACSADRDTIRYAVRATGMKLRTIVFKRASLQRLAGDPAALVKIEYLQRDLIDSAARRSEFRYPRLSRIFAMPAVRRPFSLSLSGAAGF